MAIVRIASSDQLVGRNMKRSAQRRVERQIQIIIEKDGDNCSICGKAFPHNSKTYGGLTEGGISALAGECCAKKIKHTVLSGLFLYQDYDTIPTATVASEEATLTSVQIENAVERLQNHVISVDQLAHDISKRAGIQNGKTRVTTSDNPWKVDDAEWFKANPARSHRLRSMFPSEGATLFDPSETTILPPNHELQVLVRQVKPGVRVRVQFGRNTDVPIPDIESLIHALFDLVGGASKKQGVIGSVELAKLAMSYADMADGANKKH